MMLIPSYSHWVTFGYVKSFANRLPTVLSWRGLLARSNNPEVNVYSYTGHNRLRTGEQKSCCYPAFMKMRNRTGPRTDPWGTPDSTGTGSEALPSKTTC